MPTFADAGSAIEQNLETLRKPGILAVRPGYRIEGGWPVGDPVVVALVGAKKGEAAAYGLPSQVGGVPVEVREASPLERLKATQPSVQAALKERTRVEQHTPDFPFEHLFAAPPGAVTAAPRPPAKPQIPYRPAAAALNPVTDTLTVICNASPDAGWPTLRDFFARTQQKLVVGMYDFTSAHVLAGLENALSGGGGARNLSLVLDHPTRNPTADQSDEETEQDLSGKLSAALSFAWAPVRSSPEVREWMFPTAYHIKVAVRDGKAFWLSSGNWNNSNQPDIDPIADPAGAASTARKSDRDWHVIVEHKGLSAVFEAYLQHDLEIASQHQAPGRGQAALLAALGELTQPPLTVAARTPKEYFPPHKVSARMKIQPILTPDNYVDNVLPLITGAKESFYMQTQYIHPSDKQGDEKLGMLIAAVAQKIKEGLDVRLIMSQYETLDKLELLQSAGIDLAHVRIQANVHNKGIIVDSAIVAVGSQNWSADGVIRNRDATLIIYNEDAAKYWKQIFVHDWTNMAIQQAAD